MTTAAEYQAKVSKSVTNMDRLDGIVNGGATTMVDTDGGSVPSLVKIASDYTDAVGSYAGLPEALEALEDLGIGAGPIADRGPTPFQTYRNGFHWFVTDINPPRLTVWITPGNRDPSGNIVSEHTWFGYYTQGELKNLGIGFFDTLPKANVQALPAALLDIEAVSRVRIGDFRAQLLSPGKARLTWNQYGLRPDKQVISIPGFSVTLDGGVTQYDTVDYTEMRDIFVVGNSLSDTTDVTTRWSQLVAASRGVSLTSVARYSSDARQVYRAGVIPLYLTVSGGVLPASGTSANITAINGTAPNTSADLVIYGGNPASFLNIGPGDTTTTGMSKTGTIVSGGTARHVTVSIPNGGSTAYKIQQDAGQASLTLTGPVLFVPDDSFALNTNDLILWLGNNYFFSGVANEYGDHTNPQLWVDMAAILGKATGGRVLILPVIPAANFTARGLGSAYDAYLAANARTEALYPNMYARDSLGRNMIQFLQARGDGSSGDNADIAAGFIPRSLRADALHLNAAGDAWVAAFVEDALAAQEAPPTITENTVVAITATATQVKASPETPIVTTDGALARVTSGYEAALEARIKALEDAA